MNQPIETPRQRRRKAPRGCQPLTKTRRSRSEWLSDCYDPMRRLAAGFLSRETPGHTLQATALVHEAYLRLEAQDRAPSQNRRHFLAVAARMMRRVLTDHARRRLAAKRGGGRQKVNLHEVPAPRRESKVVLTEIREALAKLARVDPRLSRIVELRCFSGLTMQEIARSLEISESSARRGWRTALEWLRRQLS